jgi:hypothetical protein
VGARLRRAAGRCGECRRSGKGSPNESLHGSQVAQAGTAA